MLECPRHASEEVRLRTVDSERVEEAEYAAHRVSVLPWKERAERPGRPERVGAHPSVEAESRRRRPVVPGDQRIHLVPAQPLIEPRLGPDAVRVRADAIEISLHVGAGDLVSGLRHQRHHAPEVEVEALPETEERRY